MILAYTMLVTSNCSFLISKNTLENLRHVTLSIHEFLGFYQLQPILKSLVANNRTELTLGLREFTKLSGKLKNQFQNMGRNWGKRVMGPSCTKSLLRMLLLGAMSAGFQCYTLELFILQSPW